MEVLAFRMVVGLVVMSGVMWGVKLEAVMVCLSVVHY